MKSSDARILKKIVEEIEFLERLLDDVDEPSFLSDEVRERAAAMASINIGELAKRLSNDFHAEYPDSDLRMAAKTRDVYAHGYFSLSFATVYKTAREDYPRLKGKIVKALEGDGGEDPTSGPSD